MGLHNQCNKVSSTSVRYYFYHNRLYFCHNLYELSKMSNREAKINRL